MAEDVAAEFSADHESEQRFTRGADGVAARTRHTVVDVLDMGDAATGALFIVQEFLSARSCGRGWRRGALPPPDEALAPFLPVMDGLAAAHEVGRNPTNIKPENIFLVRQPEAACRRSSSTSGIAEGPWRAGLPHRHPAAGDQDARLQRVPEAGPRRQSTSTRGRTRGPSAWCSTRCSRAHALRLQPQRRGR